MAHNNNKRITRYASILLKHAVKNELLEEMKDGILFLQDQFKKNPTLDCVLNNPTIPRSNKYKLLEILCKEAVGSLLWRFVEIIIEQRQIGSLKEILIYSWALYHKHIGIQSARLTTAVALPNNFIERFVEEIKHFVACNQVILEQQIDPSIIGGYILEIGDARIDKSIKHHLHTIQNHFIG
ncbi:ATP synthase F1 subunit delta [Cardinium endosymbiont of Culicoides punctatus]|uniref:ATP synthase F1 subunit delta n=1 Tax=Cardinium endosymbiont of Culicoides punctatus TaxID=2304601 RepID=UPI0010584407|nr:ATP synthase F1 subunit delta [Cardinium endosymbiont of Culicoides punctatus]TDG95367.1 ATP synthase subunit delta [Cardinium endosymbiont of Culicoides punctatus]